LCVWGWVGGDQRSAGEGTVSGQIVKAVGSG